jgi:SagB-type dehydrogenase family enzyme
MYYSWKHKDIFGIKMKGSYKDLLKRYRYFLKDSIRKTIDFSKTDQSRGIKVPPIEKPYPADALKIDLVKADWKKRFDIKLVDAIENRESQRSYSQNPLNLEEISFLLWIIQGIRLISGVNAFRNVPSAGCRHALETYLAVLNVEDIEPGIYRYLPLSHQLLFEFKENELSEKIVKSTFDQRFVGQASVIFIWTAIPYRMEWRYGLASHKVIAIDTGHVGQNLYLACEAIGAGTCAIAAYDQEFIDQLLRVDGDEESVVYLAPVGKKLLMI